jgi:hypothetical protein
MKGFFMKTRIICVAALALSAAGSGSAFAQTMRGMGMPSTGNGRGAPPPGPAAGTGSGGAMAGGAMGNISYGGGGSYGDGSSGASGVGTAGSSELSGEAALAQGLGRYNYDTALAAKQLEDARQRAIENRLAEQRAYYEMRRVNAANRLADHPHSTPEQIAERNRFALPRRLGANELDRTTGAIHWPAVLKRAEFETIRPQFEDVFAHPAGGEFGVGSTIYNRAQSLSHQMRALLDAQYASMSQMEWIQAMRFIESLAYETRFARDAATAKFTLAE